MRLDELGAPGTEYAIREKDYEAPSHARLVGIEAQEYEGTWGMTPKRRRYARMIVIEGTYREHRRRDAGVLVGGRDILAPWPEFERARAEREAKREEHKGEQARAAERQADFRSRVVALGVNAAAEEEAVERLGHSRWGLTHLLVDEGVLFALLEHAEAAAPATVTKDSPPDVRGVLDEERLREMGMPEGYAASITTIGAPSWRAATGRVESSMAARVEVRRDGVVVAERVVPMDVANDGEWLRVGIEMAQDNVRHDHELTS